MPFLESDPAFSRHEQDEKKINDSASDHDSVVKGTLNCRGGSGQHEYLVQVGIPAIVVAPII